MCLGGFEMLSICISPSVCNVNDLCGGGGGGGGGEFDTKLGERARERVNRCVCVCMRACACARRFGVTIRYFIVIQSKDKTHKFQERRKNKKDPRQRHYDQ